MGRQTNLNRIKRDYPECDGHYNDNGFEDYEIGFFDEPDDYDHEDDVPDWQRV